MIQNLLKEIKNKQMLLGEEYNKQNPEIEFFEKFVKENSFNNIEGVFEISMSDLWIVFIRSSKVDISFEELEKIIKANELFIDTCSTEELISLMSQIEEVVKDEKYDIKNHKNNNQKKLLIEKKLSSICRVVEDVYDIPYLTDDGILGLAILSDMDPDLIHNSVELISAIKKIEDVYKSSTFELCDDITCRNYGKYRNKHMKEKYKNSTLNKKIDEIKTYAMNVVQKEKLKKKECIKQIKIYDKLYKDIVRICDKKEITSYNQIISKVSDDDIKRKVLKLIDEHNRKYYEELEKEYNELSKNSSLRYQLLLKKYNINENEYDVELIMKNSYEDTKNILKQLKKMDIVEKDLIIYILKNTNKKVVDFISNLKEKGIINPDFIKNNPNIFNINSDEYCNLFKNVKNFTEKNLNPLYIYNSSFVLLINPDKFRKNIEIIDEYHYINSINTETNLKFLNQENLEQLIDSIIELGYENNLEKNLNYLNYNENKWKRLRLLKELAIDINTLNLDKILNSNDFPIPDEKLDEYIYNDTKYGQPTIINNILQESKSEEFDMLSKFSNSKRTYNINGVLISKNKVKRNLEKLNGIEMNIKDKLILATTNGSILNDEETKLLKQAYRNI